MAQQILKEPKFDVNANVIVRMDMTGFTYRIYVLRRLPDGTPYNFLTVGKNGQLETKKFDENNPFPFMQFSGMSDAYDWLGELIDVLLEMGIKPKKSVLDEKEESRLVNHLNDMRKIVGKKLEVELA